MKEVNISIENSNLEEKLKELTNGRINELSRLFLLDKGISEIEFRDYNMSDSFNVYHMGKKILSIKLMARREIGEYNPLISIKNGSYIRKYFINNTEKGLEFSLYEEKYDTKESSVSRKTHQHMHYFNIRKKVIPPSSILADDCFLEISLERFPMEIKESETRELFIDVNNLNMQENIQELYMVLTNSLGDINNYDKVAIKKYFITKKSQYHEEVVGYFNVCHGDLRSFKITNTIGDTCFDIRKDNGSYTYTCHDISEDKITEEPVKQAIMGLKRMLVKK